MPPDALHLVLSCEHGGNRVPKAYAGRFRGRRRLLQSHRGYDIGALALADLLAREFSAPVFLWETTRLLVEVNRSLRHRNLFSEVTKGLPAREKAAMLERYYWPHRRAVERAVGEAVRSGRRVLHLSVHTFTPELGGAVRNADVGLLYDPQREPERAFCLLWQEALRDTSPPWRVRRNYPYRGTADALATHLRKLLDPACYLGVELEVNQRFPLSGGPAWLRLQDVLAATLRHVFSECVGAETTSP